MKICSVARASDIAQTLNAVASLACVTGNRIFGGVANVRTMRMKFIRGPEYRFAGIRIADMCGASMDVARSLGISIGEEVIMEACHTVDTLHSHLEKEGPLTVYPIVGL